MLGDSLRLIRRMHSISGKDLAAKLGISATYLSEIENNKKKPTLELLNKYATVFKVRLSTLLFFDESITDTQGQISLRNSFIKFAKALERCENRFMEEVEE